VVQCTVDNFLAYFSLMSYMLYVLLYYIHLIFSISWFEIYKLDIRSVSLLISRTVSKPSSLCLPTVVCRKTYHNLSISKSQSHQSIPLWPPSSQWPPPSPIHLWITNTITNNESILPHNTIQYQSYCTNTKYQIPNR
jgi:hypothetical protein